MEEGREQLLGQQRAGLPSTGFDYGQKGTGWISGEESEPEELSRGMGCLGRWRGEGCPRWQPSSSGWTNPGREA